jgi:hypothetical protein
MIVLAIVTIPVLCLIQYCLTCNNNGRVRGEGKKRRYRKREKQTTQEPSKKKTKQTNNNNN